MNQENYPKILELIELDLKRQKKEGKEKPHEGSISLSAIPISAPSYTKLEYKIYTVYSIPNNQEDGIKISISLA